MSRRRALLIGIDAYPSFGPECQLAGAERDVQVMGEVLIEHHGFQPADIQRLTGRHATRAAILRELDTLARKTRRGDHVLLYFSGHGSQMTDRENDEGDGLDETLVPVDSGRSNAENRDLTDDEIHHWAAGVLRVTPHLVLIFDCCHCATLQRPGWKVRSVPADRRPVHLLPPSPIPTLRDVEAGPRPLVLAACGDLERAFELPAAVSGEPRGAFSHHLTRALRQTALQEVPGTALQEVPGTTLQEVPGTATTAISTTWRDVFANAAAGLATHELEQRPQISGDGIDRPLFGRCARSNHPTELEPADPGRQLLELTRRPDPYGLRLDLFRSRGGAWRRVSKTATVGSLFTADDRLRADVRHAHDRELFVVLLDVGLTGTVHLLFPDDEGAELLDPGRTLTIGARPEDRLDMFFPTGFEGTEGVGHLILVASEHPLATRRLIAGRCDDDGPVGAVVRSYRLSRG